MPNKKINELSVRTPSLNDLMIVGDPSTGYSYKATINTLTTFVGNNIQFSTLGGISLTTPTNGQVLQFNGTNWVNATISVPVTSVFGRTGNVVATEGDYSLTQLGDVTLSTPSTNQVLQYNGSAWVNATLTDNGITSLNGLTAVSQTFAMGTSGTDFAISSTTSTHTFNLPTASATNRGALSSADWSTFNSKQNAITLTTTGSSGSATLVGATLNIPTYTLAGLGGVSGSGTTNYLSKWTSSSALGNSIMQESGVGLFVGTTTSTGTTTPNFISLGGTYGTNADGHTNNIKLRVYDDQNSSYYSGLGTSANMFLVSSPGIIGFFTGAAVTRTERMRLTAAGRLLIGTSTESTFLLDVSGTFRSTGDANINGLTVGKGGGSVANNTAVGSGALASNTTGDFNVAIGTNALNLNTTTGQNVSVGRASMQSATASLSVAIGTNAMLSAGSGTLNVAVGQDALRSSSASSRTTALGSSSAYNTTGNFNTAVGNEALYSNTSGVNQVAVGMRSLYFATGGNNIGVGYYGGYDITTGTYNTIIGTGATGNGITTGSFNTIIGSQITGLSASLSNTIILADGQGNQRLYINNSGQVGIGTTSPASGTILHASGNQSGAYQIRISNTNTAGQTTFGAYNDNSNAIQLGIYGSTVTTYGAIAASNGFVYTTGSMAIMADGASSLIKFATGGNTERMRLTAAGRLLVGTSTESTFLLDVSGTFRSTGDANINGLTVGKGLGSVATNTAVGIEALFSNTTATNNVSLGYRTLRSATTGGFNIGIGGNSVGDGTSTLFALTTGAYNIGIGAGALRSVTTVNGNIGIGYLAGEVTTGQYNTYTGYAGGYQVTTGEYNTIVGGLSGWGITTGSNNTIIGARVQGLSASLSNTIILADGQGNQRLYINNSGNVGIGTTSPTQKLEVNGGMRLYTTGAFSVFAIGATNVGGDVLELSGDTRGSIVNSKNNYNLRFQTNGTDRATFFNSTGNLLLQSAGSHVDNGYRLDVNGTLRAQSNGSLLANTTISNLLVGSGSVTFTGLDVQASARFSAGNNYRFLSNGGGQFVMYIDAVAQNIGMGNTSTPNASALLDLTSTTKGFLPPRMTNAQMVAIATPASGLVVYDTTNNKLNVYDGTNWVAVH